MVENTGREAVELNLGELQESQFGVLVENYRRELQVHCYRMMGSVQDADDMVQETFLKAWRHRETFEGQASFRAWLYRIATNSCLDQLKKMKRRCVPVTRQDVSAGSDPIPAPVMEAVWLEPYPDHLLDVGSVNPEEKLVKRETIALAFIVALHVLAPRQRAILILRDVLNWRAKEVADLLETSVSAVKSALHRARTTLAEYENGDLPYDDAGDVLDEIEQQQLAGYVRAWETADIEGLLMLLKHDATFSMPPLPSWYRGRESIRVLAGKTVFSGEANGRWRLVPTRANGQLAFGLYRLDEEKGGYNG